MAGEQKIKLRALRPYLFISLTGLLAFAPVTFMVYALKNDLVALEYPINHFISHSLRNGVWPSWFSTWGMGFPLQSTVTWGIFSTPRILFSGLFPYNLYTLHAEFLFYILLSGWGMFYLLKRFFISEEKVALLLSIGYMLSGFTVGSSQWLLYITGAAFLPLLFSAVLHLLERPGFRYALQTAVLYTLMFTSVYAAFNIISTYLLLAGLAFHLSLTNKDRKNKIKFLFLSAVLTLVFCLPVLAYSLEVIRSIDRGSGISQNTAFFHSNYLHPLALKDLLFPLSSIKMNYPNTEGTMLHSYMGLVMLILLPLGLRNAIRDRNKPALVMAGLSLFFLLAAFGHYTPLRDLLNYLPGFSYFRHAAIFRFYFIFFLFIFVATSLKAERITELMGSRSIRNITLGLLFLAFITLIFSAISPAGIWKGSFQQTIHALNEKELTFLSAIIQVSILLPVLFSLKKRSFSLFSVILSADLLINTLLCLPFYGVSSYSPATLNQLFGEVNAFPVQQEPPSMVPAVLRDPKGNDWQNINVFRQKISAAPSYRGPLELKGPIPGEKGKGLVYAPFDSNAIVRITIQEPAHIQVKVKATKNCLITLAQNKYPGWKVKVNDQGASRISCYRSLEDHKTYYPPPGISVLSPAGETTVDFIYERKEQFWFAILLHSFLICWLLWRISTAIRSIQRSSSLS